MVEITVRSRLPADLTGDGFVDFDDLTLLLAHWDQMVSAAQGNLVDPLTTPINFQDLTLLLAEWTGPGPVGAGQAAVGGGDSVGDFFGTGPSVAIGDASHRRRDRRATDLVMGETGDGVGDNAVMLMHNLRGGRRLAGGSYAGRQAGSLSYGRLQAVAVDRAMGEVVEGTAPGRRGRQDGRRR